MNEAWNNCEAFRDETYLKWYARFYYKPHHLCAAVFIHLGTALCHLDLWINSCICVQPVLLVGGSGTAKTNITNQFLGSFDPDQSAIKTITFSSLTSPGIFQATIEASFLFGISVTIA